MENKEMYQEEILHLYNNPRNFGKLAMATHSFRGLNASCGDDLSFDLVVEDGKVFDVKFSGKGCAICMASASLLSEAIKGKGVEEIRRLDKDFVLGLLKINVNPARMKCALLSLESVKGALKNG